MKTAVRWPGLIAFGIIVALLVAVILLFGNSILRLGLQTGLADINGAEVNVADARINWRPFEVEIRNVQFTDPLAPEMNRFQADRASFAMSISEALVGRIRIRDLTATGIAMSVERASRGWVDPDYLAQLEAQSDEPGLRDRLNELDIRLPSVDELIDRAEIQTPRVVEEVTHRTRETQRAVADRVDELPDSERLQTYEEQLRELRNMRPRSLEDFDRAQRQLTELRDELRADRERVTRFIDSVENARTQLSSDIELLRTAPADDVRRVRSLMTTDTETLGELAEILFGPQVQEWTDYVLAAFDFVGPLLERLAAEAEEPSPWEGQFIHFDREERPTMLIEQAHTQIDFADTLVDVHWDNITWQHQRLGAPTSYSVNISETSLWNSLSAGGELFLGASGFSGTQEWALQGARVDNLTLLIQPELTARLQGATINSQGSVALEQSQLNGSAGVELTNVSLSAEGDPRWVRMLDNALSEIRAFNLDVNVRGDMASPRLSLDSNLDNQLAGAFTNVMQQAAEEVISDVRAQLETEVQRALADVQPRLDQVRQWSELARERDNLLQDLLSQEVDNLRDRARNELENLFRDRLRELGRGN